MPGVLRGRGARLGFAGVSDSMPPSERPESLGSLRGTFTGARSDSGEGGEDALYDQAVEIVLKNRRASISLVQRHLRIGYNRSARLIEAMEKAGLVSAMDGRGGREVIARKEEN